MTFANFVTELQGIWDMTFAFSDTLDVSLGQLIIFTIMLSVGISYYRRLRG